MEMSETSTKRTTTHEQSEPDQILSQRQSLQLNQRKWWISVMLCLFLVLLGDSLVMLLLNFFYVQVNREDSDQDQQYKGTWMQALIQNAAFPILIPLFFIFGSPKPSQETNSSTTPFLSCSTSLLPFLQPSLTGFKYTRWIIISVILTIPVYVFGRPEFGGEPDEDEEFYNLQAWLTFAASLAFALSLCLIQLGFDKLLVKTKRYNNKKVFRMVLEMQICISFVASVVCLVGLFASGEFKELKDDSQRFKKGKTYYVLSLVWLALSWQVWAVGLIGLVLYVSGVFSDIVHMCVSPLVALFVVSAFDFMDDEVSWPRIGALIGAAFALGSYFYSLHNKNKKEMLKLNQREDIVEV